MHQLMSLCDPGLNFPMLFLHCIFVSDPRKINCKNYQDQDKKPSESFHTNSINELKNVSARVICYKAHNGCGIKKAQTINLSLFTNHICGLTRIRILLIMALKLYNFIVQPKQQ